MVDPSVEKIRVNKGKRLRLEQACFNRLRKIDPNIKISRQQISDFSHIPLKTLSNTINGHQDPNSGNREKFCSFLGIDHIELDELLAAFHLSSNKETNSQNGGGSDTYEANVDQSQTSLSAADTNSETKIGKSSKISFLLIASAICAVGISFSLMYKFRENTVASDDIANKYCVIDFGVRLDEMKACNSIGSFSIVGPNMGQWNGNVTGVRVPVGWRVYARYELWMPPNYDYIAEDGHGYVLLREGLNMFDSMSFDLYEDFELTKLVKETKPNEMNDRIQNIIIESASAGTSLIVYAHKELDDAQRLTITLME